MCPRQFPPDGPWVRHALAAEREEFDGFGGGITRRAKMRPAGLLHALSPFDDCTLCGRPREGLVVYGDRLFEDEPVPSQCAACRGAAWLRRRAAR